MKMDEPEDSSGEAAVAAASPRKRRWPFPLFTRAAALVGAAVVARRIVTRRSSRRDD